MSLSNILDPDALNNKSLDLYASSLSIGENLTLYASQYSGAARSSYSIYRSPSTQNVVNTIVETSLFNDNDAVGSRILPANSLTVGDTVHIKMIGLIGVASAAEPLNLRFYLDGNLISEDVFSFSSGSFLRSFEIDVSFIVKNIGTSGSLFANGKARRIILDGTDQTMSLTTTRRATQQTTKQHGIATNKNFQFLLFN